MVISICTGPFSTSLFPFKKEREVCPFSHKFCNEMCRFRPIEFEMRAYPIDIYPARSRNAAAIMLMIMNNLDPRVIHSLCPYIRSLYFVFLPFKCS